MLASMSTAILIVGMHRSGTSVLAGLLGKLGIPLGDHLLEPGSDNPKGYWEHQDVVSAHEYLLRALGSRWDDVRTLPKDWLQSEPAQLAAAAIGDVITRDFSDKPLWAVKDPRICRLLPLWLQVLRERQIQPVVLFMVRRPSEVSASIESRNQWNPLVGELLWLRYMTEALAASSTAPREVVLYDDLLVDPITSVATALARVGVEIAEEISPTKREVIAQFVDPTDRHHAKPRCANSALPLVAFAEEIYESLAEIAHGTNRWEAVNKLLLGFEKEWRNSGACVAAVADMAARIEADLHVASLENLRVASALNAQILWSEEARSKHEALQAQNAGLSSQLTAQIRWSEEAQAQRESLQAENAELSSKLAMRIRQSEKAQADYKMLLAQHAELGSHLLDKRRECARQAAELHAVTERHDLIVDELDQTRSAKLAVDSELRTVYASRSWTMTSPLRSISKLLTSKSGRSKSLTRKAK